MTSRSRANDLPQHHHTTLISTSSISILEADFHKEKSNRPRGKIAM
jgi:hypothetical protein